MTDYQTCASTDTYGAGCGGFFVNKETPGLCSLCEELGKHEEGSSSHRQTMAMKQCVDCGVGWRRLVNGDRCGGCGLKANSTPGSTQREQRAIATQQRLKKPLTVNPLAAVSIAPTVPLASGGHNYGPRDGDEIFVTMIPKIKTTVQSRLGNFSKSFDSNETMGAVIQAGLDTFNLSWTRTPGAQKLTRRDILVRLPGNKNPLPGPENGPLEEFYKRHLQATGKEVYLPKISGYKGVKGTSIVLELLIDMDAYYDRTDPDGDSRQPGKKSKRARSVSDHVPDKRARGSVVQSSFVRSVVPKAVPRPIIKKTEAKFRLGDAVVNSNTGKVRIEWQDPDCLKNVVIFDSLSGSGVSKNVYKMQTDGQNYVVKRFFDVGMSDHSPPTPARNREEVEAEIFRIHTAQWFLGEFQALATEKGVEIATNFDFTSCQVAEEIIPNDGGPSPASGYTKETLAAEADFDSGLPRIIWLVEPFRSPLFERFTGTMKHPALPGMLGESLSAFVHFAYDHSNCEVVFADLQGSVATMRNGHEGTVLFDIMSHSPDGDSGLGDHGVQGLNCWLEQHHCNRICKQLELEDMQNYEQHIAPDKRFGYRAVDKSVVYWSGQAPIEAEPGADSSSMEYLKDDKEGWLPIPPGFCAPSYGGLTPDGADDC